jgi:hypothetical protein
LSLVLGFAYFVWLLPNQEVALDRSADGIVVLTGGTSRVSDALELLAPAAASASHHRRQSRHHDRRHRAQVVNYDRLSGLLRRPRLFGAQHARQRGAVRAAGRSNAAFIR